MEKGARRHDLQLYIVQVSGGAFKTGLKTPGSGHPALESVIYKERMIQMRHPGQACRT
jgi:hypothetical protein